MTAQDTAADRQRHVQQTESEDCAGRERGERTGKGHDTKRSTKDGTFPSLLNRQYKRLSKTEFFN